MPMQVKEVGQIVSRDAQVCHSLWTLEQNASFLLKALGVPLPPCIKLEVMSVCWGASIGWNHNDPSHFSNFERGLLPIRKSSLTVLILPIYLWYLFVCCCVFTLFKTALWIRGGHECVWANVLHEKVFQRIHLICVNATKIRPHLQSSARWLSK